MKALRCRQASTLFESLEMRLDKKHPMNRLVLEYLWDPKRLRFSSEPIVGPDEHDDPYREAGAHPDVVERVWIVLGESLTADCRAVVYGTPALVHPDAGVVFALATGTAYRIRVPVDTIDEAIKLGCQIEREWTAAGKTNIENELGRGWVFGSWLDEESLWLARVFHDLLDHT